MYPILGYNQLFNLPICFYKHWRMKESERIGDIISIGGLLSGDPFDLFD